MNIDFSKAKNGQETCSVNNKFYHSRYNPQNECEKWISQVDCNFNPMVILVLGAGLPYSVNLLKKRFTKSQIYLIQYHKDFIKKSNYQNQILTSDFKTENQMGEFLFQTFGEELCNRILILSWKPSELIFNEEFLFTNKAIQIYFNKAKNVISTRRYFSKKWFYNSVRFFSFCRNFAYIEKGNSDIIVAASGPSLQYGIDFLKNNRKNYFLIAVSSALSPLVQNNIIPDLVISTDGGFWAKKHLDCLLNVNYNIPILCSIESGLPFNLLKKSTFIPFNYCDFTNNIFFDLTKIKYLPSQRNGTVSGNGVETALSLTTGNIYTIGIDLEYTKGFQHTQPNLLELRDSYFDNKIENTESRIMKRNLNSQSLAMYKSWFENMTEDKTSRIQRLFPDKHENLGNIQSIKFTEVNFNSKLNMTEKLKLPEIQKQTNIDVKKTIFCYLSHLLDILTNSEIQYIYINYKNWLKELSLGNILNYEKFENTDFLIASIIETTDCLKYVVDKLR